jgi:hypothetical protein
MKFRNLKFAIEKLRGHERLAKQARVALTGKQVERAATLIESGKIRFPRSDTFRILDARHSLLTANTQAAEEAIESVDWSKSRPVDGFELAECYRQLGRYAQCVDVCHRVAQEGPVDLQRQAISAMVISYLRLQQYDDAVEAAVRCVKLGGWHQAPMITELAGSGSRDALQRAIAQLQLISTPDPWHENHRQRMIAAFARTLGRWPLACKSIREATRAVVSVTRPDLKWDEAQPALVPRVLLIGAMKSGTSALFHCLLDHPQFVTPQQKELHYFGDENVPREYYFEQFPRLAPDQRKALITGEASPGYYAMPIVSQVRKLLPDVRLIFIQRNPVDRAISHLFHNRNLGIEEHSIEALTNGCDQILQLAKLSVEDFQHSLSRICSGELSVNRYLFWGCYELFLRSWRTEFGNQLMTLQLEDFSKNPQAEMDKVFQFLEMDRHSVSLPNDTNAGRYDSQTDTLIRVRGRLKEFYHAIECELRNHNEQGH